MGNYGRGGMSTNSSRSLESIVSELQSKSIVQVPPGIFGISACIPNMVYRIGSYNGTVINQACKLDSRGTASYYLVSGDVTLPGSQGAAAVQSLTRGAAVGQVLEGTTEIINDLNDQEITISRLIDDLQKNMADLRETLSRRSDPLAQDELRAQSNHLQQFQEMLNDIRRRKAGAQASRSVAQRMTGGRQSLSHSRGGKIRPKYKTKKNKRKY